ncbi:zinc finger domain-containing protein [Streptomyces sp. RPT161]|uniref:zinc finger domain-containing protein n=1 Tax=Streptomyces sp. RPT161 TaxID=3015993 RepID=UPI003FCE657F
MTPDQAALAVERHDCPNCDAPAGSACRTRGGIGGSGNGRDRLGTNVCGQRSGTGTPLLAECWPRSGSPRPIGRKWTRCTGPTCSPRDGSDTPDARRASQLGHCPRITLYQH